MKLFVVSGVAIQKAPCINNVTAALDLWTHFGLNAGLADSDLDSSAPVIKINKLLYEYDLFAYLFI